MALQLMREIDFDKASTMVRKDPKARELFKVLREATAKPDLLSGMVLIQSERPFLSARAWAAFSAYFAVLSFAYVQLNLLAVGSGNMTSEALEDEAIKKLLKSALPNSANLIDKYGIKIFPFLIDQLGNVRVQRRRPPRQRRAAVAKVWCLSRACELCRRFTATALSA